MQKSVKLISLGLVLTAATLFILTACSDNQGAKKQTGSEIIPQNTENTMQDDSNIPVVEVKLGRQSTEETAQNDQLSPPKTGDTVAILETDMGTIKFKLFPNLVPEIAKNFITLANDGKYNNVPFHRVIKDFMVQTGDFTDKNGMGGYSYKGKGTELPDEIVPSLKHLYGTVSMANHGPNTNGSQFFIVTNKNGTPFLDGGYSVFGQVYEGMEVALKIADLQSPDSDSPTRTVNIKSVTIETVK